MTYYIAERKIILKSVYSCLQFMNKPLFSIDKCIENFNHAVKK